MAFVATGMNTEQLIGQNGMAYKIGLPLVSIYAIAFAVYSLLVFVFLPVYLRNGILTMPDYLRRRFPGPSADLFTVLLLLSYVFLNLAGIREYLAILPGARFGPTMAVILNIPSPRCR